MLELDFNLNDLCGKTDEELALLARTDKSAAADSSGVPAVSKEERAAASRPHPKPQGGRQNRFTQGTRILGPNDPRLLRVEGDTTLR